MAGKYVLDGAKIKCPLCSKKKGKLKVTSNKVQLQDKPAATEGDNGKPNLQFQGNCTHPQFSGGPPPPCKSVISVAQWQNTSETKFDDQKALVEGSQIMCQTGKVPITIADTTQKATPTNLAAMDAACAPVPGGSVQAKQPAHKAEANYNSFVTDEPVDTNLTGELTIRDAYFARRKETQKYKPQTTNYTVKKGDTLSAIADQFDSSIAKITEASKIEDVSSIEVGQQLRIPHQVKDGKEVSFERDHEATLGQEVYIVVTYMGEIDSGTVEVVEKEPLLSESGTLKVLQGGSETSSIELEEPEAKNLQGYKMVAKVKLRPKSDKDLDKWRDTLAKEDPSTTFLSIKVEAKGGEEVEKVKYRDKNNSNVFLSEGGEWFEVSGPVCYCHPQGLVDSPCGGIGTSIEERHYQEASEELGVEKAVLKAIAKQESDTDSFWEEGQATILFERHIMWRYLKKDTGKTIAELIKLKKNIPIL